MDSIINIKTATKYNKKIETLFNYHKQKRMPRIDCGNDVLTALLNYAHKNNKICSVILCESGNNDVVGFVKSIGKDLLTVHGIDDFGDDDGEIVVNLDRISAVICNSTDEASLEILYKSKTK